MPTPCSPNVTAPRPRELQARLGSMIAVVAFASTLGACAARATAPAGVATPHAPIPSRPASAASAASTASPDSARSTTRTETTSDVATDAYGREPTTLTGDGDSGLWTVPTALVLDRGQWSVGLQRRSASYREGSTTMSEWPLTFGVGVASRVEVFGAMSVHRRIARGLRPLFSPDPSLGGVLARHPLITDATSEGVGDVALGAKVSLLSEAYGRAVAVAVRGLVKIPVASADTGLGTGRVDGGLDAVVSGRIWQALDVSGYAGVALRGAPDGVSSSNALRYGIGAAYPARGRLQVTAEAVGETPFASQLSLGRSLVAADGSVAPATTRLGRTSAATFGITWRLDSGVFLGAAATWNFPSGRGGSDATGAGTFGGASYQFRVGFGGGTRRFAVPPPSPAPMPPPPPPPPANRPPQVSARCEPCTVVPGQSLQLSADGIDPDGDVLSYRWTVPVGTLADANARETRWTAPAVLPPSARDVQAVVVVHDGKGGTSEASVRLRVEMPAPSAAMAEPEPLPRVDLASRTPSHAAEPVDRPRSSSGRAPAAAAAPEPTTGEPPVVLPTPESGSASPPAPPESPEGLSQFRWIQYSILALGVVLYLVTLGTSLRVPNPTPTQARSLKLGESLSAGAFMAAIAGLTSQWGASANDAQAAGVMLVGGLGAFALVYTDFRPFALRDPAGPSTATPILAASSAGAATAAPAAPWPDGAIFVSYRRDEWAIAGRIRDRLNDTFGDRAVYFDRDDTAGRWKRSIDEALDRASVLVAVIGPQWERILDTRAREHATDEVRHEIESALARGITVIPIIVGDDTELPAAARVDPSLHAFYQRLGAWQYRSLRQGTWDYELGVVVRDITHAIRSARSD